MIMRRFSRAWKEHGSMGLIRHVFRNKFPLHICLVYRKTYRSNSYTVPGLLIERYSSRSAVGLEIIDTLRMPGGVEMSRGVDKLFSQGCELWLGRLEGKTAGICWSRMHKRRSDYFIPLEETDATILSCDVFPAFRGQGIFPAMLQTMVNTLMDHDQICQVYIDCKSWNTASIRGIQKAGFVSIGKAVRMVLFDRVWILWNHCSSK
jgi:hypothetical protein